jgi:hypothetical protein
MRASFLLTPMGSTEEESAAGNTRAIAGHQAFRRCHRLETGGRRG